MDIGYRTGVQGIDEGRPSLIFIHGAGGSSLGWQGQLSTLGKNFNTIALDLPGHGQTPGPAHDAIEGYADWLEGAIEELVPGRFVLVGHSMGGAIAQMFGLANPGRAAGLVLVGTGAALPVNPKILEGVKADFERTSAMIIDWCFAVDDPGLKKISLEQTLAAGPEVVHGDFLACANFDVVDRLDRVDAPALVITGREDKMTPPTMAEFLVGRLPGAELALVEGAGHMVHVEKTREVNDLIANFAGHVFD